MGDWAHYPLKLRPEGLVTALSLSRYCRNVETHLTSTNAFFCLIPLRQYHPTTLCFALLSMSHGIIKEVNIMLMKDKGREKVFSCMLLAWVTCISDVADMFYFDDVCWWTERRLKVCSLQGWEM